MFDGEKESKNPCVKELVYVIILILLSASWGMCMGFWSEANDPRFCGWFDIHNRSDTSGGLINYHCVASATSLGTIYNMMACFGAIFGGPVIGLVVARTGRRVATFLIALVTAICWLIFGSMYFWTTLPDGVDYRPESKDTDYSHMVAQKLTLGRGGFALACILRAIIGLGVGATATIVPVYITELSPFQLRGIFGALHQVGISIGNTTGYLIGIWLQNWWTLAFIFSIPSILQCALIWFVPRSRVRIDTGDDRETPFRRQNLGKFVLAILICFCQQLGGTSAFLGTLTDTFEQAGITALSPAVCSFLTGVCGLLAAVLGSALVGFLGEKRTWIISSACQLVTLIAGAVQQFTGKAPGVFIACIFLNNFTFCAGTAGIAWFFVTHLFSDAERAKATGAVTFVSWILGTAVFYVWDAMRHKSTGGGLLLFAGVMFFSTILGFFLNEPPAEIDDNDGPDAMQRRLSSQDRDVA